MKRSPFSRDPWYIDAIYEVLPVLLSAPVLIVLYLGLMGIRYLLSLS